MSSTALTAVQPRSGAHAREDRAGLALFCASLVFNYATFRVVDPYALTFDWQSVLRIVLLGVCGGYAVCNYRLALERLMRFPMAWLLLYIGWAWLTLPAAISVNYAAAACLTLTSSALFTAALLERTSGESIAKSLVVTLALLSIACWIAQYAWPDIANVNELFGDIQPIKWRLGGLMHPNGLGAHCAVGIGMLCVGRITWKWPWRPIVALALLFLMTLLATNSRTSLMMIGVALSFFAVRKAPALLALGGAVLAAAFLVGELAGADWSRGLVFASRRGTMEEITSFTGRTDLWAIALDHIAQSPVWGWGYGCSRFVFMKLAIFPAQHPHNMFLDTMFETGIVGGLIQAAMALALVRRLLVRPCPFPDMILLMVLVMGTAEVPVFNPVPEIFTLSWMLALGWQREDREFSILDLQLQVPHTAIQNPIPARRDKIQNMPGVAS